MFDGADFLSGDLTSDSLGLARLSGLSIGEMPEDSDCCWVVVATTSCTHTIRGTGEACCWIVVATTGCSTTAADDESGDESGDC